MDGRTWKTYRECQIEAREEALTGKCWQQLPADQQVMARQHIEQEIRQLQDGTWVQQQRQTISMVEKMIEDGTWSLGTPGAETAEATKAIMQVQLRRLKGELEVAGETP